MDQVLEKPSTKPAETVKLPEIVPTQAELIGKKVETRMGADDPREILADIANSPESFLADRLRDLRNPDLVGADKYSDDVGFELDKKTKKVKRDSQGNPKRMR